MADDGFGGTRIERLIGDLEMARARSTTHRWNKGELVAIGKNGVEIRVRVIDHDHGGPFDRSQARKLFDQRVQDSAGRGSRIDRKGLLAAAGNLAYDGEMTQGD